MVGLSAAAEGVSAGEQLLRGSRGASSAAACARPSPAPSAAFAAVAVSAPWAADGIEAAGFTAQGLPTGAWPGGPAVAALLGASLLGGGVAAAEAAEADAAAEVEGEEPPGGPSWSEAVQQLRRLTFFTYERRLREHSTTEKIFDYFSSIKEGSSKFMTETDLMRSVVPVFPVGEEVRSGALDGERACSGVSPLTRLGSAFDIDGNGRIDFREYLVFLHLMSISLEDLEAALVAMDTNQNGLLNINEMQAAIGWQGSCGKSAPRTGMDTEHVARGAFMPALFGPDGSRRVPLAEVRAYMTRLHHDLAELEFEHYDPQGKGFISGDDFAHAAVSSMPLAELDASLARIQQLPRRLLRRRVSKREFQEFVRLHGHSQTFQEAARTKGCASLEAFRDVVRSDCGCELSDTQLEILFLMHQRDGQEGDVTEGVLTMLDSRTLKHLAQAALTSTVAPWQMLSGSAALTGHTPPAGSTT